MLRGCNGFESYKLVTIVLEIQDQRDCGGGGGIYVRQVKNTLECICSQRVSAHCGVLPLRIISHVPSQPKRRRWGDTPFFGGSPPEVGSWEADAGEWSGVYEVWSGGRWWWRAITSLPPHRGAVIRQEHGDRLRLAFKGEEEHYQPRRSGDLEYPTTTLFSARVGVWMARPSFEKVHNKNSLRLWHHLWQVYI